MEDMKNIDIDLFTICIFKIWTKNEALSLDVRTLKLATGPF